MKYRKTLIFALVLLAAAVCWWDDRRQAAPAGSTFAPSAAAEEGITRGISAASAGVTSVNEAQALSADATPAPELPAVAPRLYFPGAKVLATYQAAASADGSVRVVKHVETGMEEKVVRLEEVYEGGVVRADHLVDQIAMVANQLLTKPADGVAEERFLGILRAAGATDVRPVGESFLVTFAADPRDAQALDGFRARLLAAADGAVVAEPNYIRRLF